jgi:hypothetical protein
MFQNDAQACAAIRALLASLFDDVDRWWLLDGPTDAAVDVLGKGGYLSHGEAVLIRCAFAFWNQSSDATLADVLGVLDGQRARAVLSLARAFHQGPSAIHAWIIEEQGT